MRARTVRLGADYSRLWLAWVGSNIGDGVVLAAIPLFASRLTRDPVAVAGVTFAASSPWLLFGLFAGVIVDRVSRRRLMWIVDGVRASVLLLFVIAIATDSATMAMVYASVLLLGIGETLFDTASQSVLPAVVPTEHLEVANGRLFGAGLAANEFIGPPLGGWLFALTAAGPFLFDAATFGLSALLLFGLKGHFKPQRHTKSGLLMDLREGLSYLWDHRIIRAFAIGAAVINIGYTASAAILVLFAQDSLRLDDVGFGLLLSGGAIGGIVGTVVAAPLVQRLGRSISVLASVAVMALTLGAIILTVNPWVVAVTLSVFGFAVAIWNVVAVSYRQSAVPDELLGRIMASYRFVAYGAYPLGAALGGLLAARVALHAPFIVGATLIGLLLLYLTPLLIGADLTPQAPAMRPEA